MQTDFRISYDLSSSNSQDDVKLATISSFPSLTTDTTSLPREIESGNVEYKLKLLNISLERFSHLATQMRWRLKEGNGVAVYFIGVNDHGNLTGLTWKIMETSLSTLRRIAGTVSSQVVSVHTLEVKSGFWVAECLVKRLMGNSNRSAFEEIRVALVGPGDSGKSSLLGVLTHSDKDNSRGKARLSLLRHPHEIISGKTSSLSHQILGFNDQGQCLNFRTCGRSWEGIVENSTSGKLVSFLDTCGHSRYLRTTFGGICGWRPDVCIFVLSAPEFSKTTPSSLHHIAVTKDLVQLAKKLNCIVMVCLNKMDRLVDLKVVFSVLQDVFGNVEFVNGTEAWTSGQIPVFYTSAVSGQGLEDVVEAFRKLDPPHKPLMDEDVKFQVDRVFSVPDVGPVVGGVLLSGQLSNSNTITLFLGPVNARGDFVPVQVTSIHRQRVPVRVCLTGEAATLALDFPEADKPVEKVMQRRKRDDIFSFFGDDDYASSPVEESTLYRRDSNSSEEWNEFTIPGVRLRRGMMLVSKPIAASMDFRCKMSQPPVVDAKGSVHIGSVRQRVYVREVTGDVVKFRFLNEPEVVLAGEVVVFRDEARKMHLGRVL